MSLNPIVASVSRLFDRVRTGLDVGFSDPAFIEQLRAARRGNWESVPTAHDLPYEDNQFDVVVLAESSVDPIAVREANRVLCNGGYLIFSIHKERGQLSDIYKLVRNGFDIADVKRESWWSCHSFHGPLTVCARKKNWKEPRSLGGTLGSPFLSFVFFALFASGVGAAVLPSVPFVGSSEPVSRGPEDVVRLLNSRASGNAKSYAEAAKAVARAAENGHPFQSYLIALVSDEPSAPAAARISKELRAEYLESSRDKIRKFAEEKNDPLAWYLLSLEKDDEVLLKRAADGGSVHALNSWGTKTLVFTLSDRRISDDDRNAVLARCFAGFKRAADQNDANGLYNLGMCYQNGYGTEKNENLAYDCFLSAAQMDHPEAINNLGGYYRTGTVVTRNLETAAEWFKKSADLGNSYGQLNYALALQRGEGVMKDEELAVSYLSQAAAQGNVEAMNAYGMCFYNGVGVERNDMIAVLWFKNAASRGDAMAMDNLAGCCRLGRGMPQDDEASILWMVRARAARGDLNAQAWLMKNERRKKK